ncbi:MAG: BatA domain-containing protein [Pirellulales bacterium]|nr:BatA domain-containing protein [Pirellulales bacterium]
MDFLNPALLAGSALAAAPIVLHLVLKQKPRQFEFPALRFLEQRRQVNERRLRLRHWLLLALRVAALALLALALARPSMQASHVLADREAPVAAVLVFDTSPRMAYRQQNQTRLEAAQEFGRWIVGQLPEDSQVAVLDTRYATAVFQVDAAAAKLRIDRLEIASLSQPLLQVVQEGLRLLADSKLARKEIYLLTDLSRGGWQTTSPAALVQRLDALGDLGIYVIDVGATDPRNVALADIKLSSQVLAANSPVIVSSEVRYEAPAGSPAVDRTVELDLPDADGKLQRRSELAVKLAPGQSQRVDFPLGGFPIGTHQGQLKLSGEDALVADDARYFTVDVQPTWKVLIAAPAPAGRTGVYLAEALAPEQWRKQGLARFHCDVIDWQRLDATELAPYTAVFLLDPGPMTPAAWQRLLEYVHAGGGAAICLGRRAQPLEEFQRAADPLLPGRLEGIDAPGDDAAGAAGATTGAILRTAGTSHPLLSKFVPLADAVPWDAFPVARRWRFADTREQSAVAMSFADGQPAMFEQRLGRGRLLTLVTSLSDQPDERPIPWNQLLTGLEPWPGFMLANEMALYLVDSTEGQLNYAVGQTAALRLRPDDHVTSYVLTTPTGDNLKGSVAAAAETLTVAGNEWPGHYQLRSGGTEGGWRRGYSANVPADASRLERVAPDEVQSTFGKRTVHVARSQAEMEREISTSRVGRELYPLVMVVLAVALGLEQILANRFYRQV